MLGQHLLRQPKLAADAPDFILEKFAQRLDQLERQIGRQSAHVMMRLDGRRGASHRPPIRSRPDRACPAPESESPRVAAASGPLRRTREMNSAPMRLRLSSGSVTPFRRARKRSDASTPITFRPTRSSSNSMVSRNSFLRSSAVIHEDIRQAGRRWRGAPAPRPPPNPLLRSARRCARSLPHLLGEWLPPSPR